MGEPASAGILADVVQHPIIPVTRMLTCFGRCEHRSAILASNATECVII
jgi:hypothetical protein